LAKKEPRVVVLLQHGSVNFQKLLCASDIMS